MKLTIITPTLNQAAFIGDTLRSVADQDYPHIEHIVMDGGSTDGTLDILREWGGRWVSAQDRGQADAIANGIALATGDVMTWLNSDDFYLAPTVVSAVMARFDAGAQVVTGLGTMTREDGTPWYAWSPRHLRYLDDTLRSRDTVLQPATFYRMALARRIPLDPTLRYAFDWDFFIRLRAAAPFTALPLPIAGYRWHPDAKTMTGGAARKRELLEISRRYRGRRHPATLAMMGLVPLYGLADRLPAWPRQQAYRALDIPCRISQRLTGNRGIQE